MANRTMGGAQVSGGVAVVRHADLSTVGAKATYTCPGNRQATVRFISSTEVVAGGTLQPVATIGGVAVALALAAATFSMNVSVTLNAGDSVALVGVGTGAGAQNDLLICADEFLAA